MRELHSWRRVRLSLVRENADAPYAQPKTVKSGTDVAELVRAFLRDDPRELFVAVYLDGKHRPTAIHACSVGTANNATVHPREVFGPALLHGACAMVVAHNHPSGDATPSPEDRLVTERLREAGDLMGIEVLDHVVIGEGRFYSFIDESYHPFRELGE
jgi:DNA repair protein RadC